MLCSSKIKKLLLLYQRLPRLSSKINYILHLFQQYLVSLLFLSRKYTIMAAKGRKRKVAKVQKEQEPESSDEEVDLETMERMLDESDSEGISEKSSDQGITDDSSAGDNSANEELEEAEELESDEEGESIDGDVENETIEGDEKCNIDLRNLLAFNSHQLNHKKLYMRNSNQHGEETTISTNGMKLADDSFLLGKASAGCSQLLAGLWKLETEKTDAGPMAILPSYFETVTPRELPPPPPKAETKWEKFAKERGIGTKEKRSRKVWDEATGEWAYRTGYQKASSANDPMSWPIMEVKRNDDPFDDPWQKARDAKKDRVDKNTMNRLRNVEKAGGLERGTTRRIMKAKAKEREDGRRGGSLDMKNFQNVPSGIPIDMANKQLGKNKTKLALLATQRSTASLGKFDQMREGEPERRKAMAGMKKRKFESSTSKDVVKSEAKKSMKVFENVIAGGGKAKERAIRRGEHAKGETGHDYDYNDGGYAGYKKKKGRAGIGKMKKVTKKMAK